MGGRWIFTRPKPLVSSPSDISINRPPQTKIDADLLAPPFLSPSPSFTFSHASGSVIYGPEHFSHLWDDVFVDDDDGDDEDDEEDEDNE